MSLTFHFFILHCGITAVWWLLRYSDTEHQLVTQYIKFFFLERIPTTKVPKSSLSLLYTQHKWTCKQQNSGESHTQLTVQWCMSMSARLLEEACYVCYNPTHIHNDIKHRPHLHQEWTLWTQFSFFISQHTVLKSERWVQEYCKRESNRKQHILGLLRCVLDAHLFCIMWIHVHFLRCDLMGFTMQP